MAGIYKFNFIEAIWNTLLGLALKLKRSASADSQLWSLDGRSWVIDRRNYGTDQFQDVALWQFYETYE